MWEWYFRVVAELPAAWKMQGNTRGKPLMQPHTGLTAAPSLQHHENSPIKRASNHRAISGTATWIHHQKVPLTQQAGFMAPPIKPAPDRGGEEKITAHPLGERRSFK